MECLNLKCYITFIMAISKAKTRKRYSNPRPRIPAPIQRIVRVESGHACLVCKERVSLQIHHIDGNRENNVPENLANICANCHGMEQDGKISPQEFRDYKQKAQEDNEELAKLKQSIEYLVTSPKITVSGNFKELKLKYHSLLNDYTDKLIFYQCFIYLIPEFYLDTRGDEVRKTVREVLSVTAEEERSIIDHLVQMDIVEVVGDLITLRDNKDAKTALAELIKSGQVDIDKIMSAFLGV